MKQKHDDYCYCKTCLDEIEKEIEAVEEWVKKHEEKTETDKV